jgi:hypothetical protein
MTFLVEIVLETVLRTLVWTAIIAGIAAVATGAVVAGSRLAGRAVSWLPTGWIAAAGAAVAVALPERFTWPPGPAIAVWRWDIPILWAAGGAIAGALVGWAVARRARRIASAGAEPESAA